MQSEARAIAPACHVATGTGSPPKNDWKLPANTSSRSGAAPTSCIGCHVGDRPSGAVGPAPRVQSRALNINGLPDPNGLGMGDCRSCHTTGVGVTWTGGFFNHVPKPTTCAGCHLLRSPRPWPAPRSSALSAQSTDGRTYQNDYLHSLVAGDCVACHIVRGATQTDWTGGTTTTAPHRRAARPATRSRSPPLSSTASTTRSRDSPTARPATPFPGKVDRRLGDSDERHSDAPDREDLAQHHGAAPRHRCRENRPDLRDLSWHEHERQDHRVRPCVSCGRQQVRLLPLHRPDRDVGLRSLPRLTSGTSNTKDCTASGCHRPTYPTWNASTKKFSGGAWGEP